MTALIASKFLEILNMGVASGATHEHEDHAPEGLTHEVQEKGRQEVKPAAAVLSVSNSRRLPRDFNEWEEWA